MNVWAHVLGRMRPAIHPDRAALLVGAENIWMAISSCVSGCCSSQIRNWFGPKNMYGSVYGRALVLEHRVPRHVPAVAEHPRRFVDRQAAEVARLFAGHAIGLILVIPPVPVADEADLRKRRSAGDAQRRQRADGGRRAGWSAASRLLSMTCVFDRVLCRWSLRSGRHSTSWMSMSFTRLKRLVFFHSPSQCSGSVIVYAISSCRRPGSRRIRSMMRSCSPAGIDAPP